MKHSLLTSQDAQAILTNKFMVDAIDSYNAMIEAKELFRRGETPTSEYQHLVDLYSTASHSVNSG